jgi:hypothetical protein
MRGIEGMGAAPALSGAKIVGQLLYLGVSPFPRLSGE